MRRLILLLGTMIVLTTVGTSAVLAQRVHIVQIGETLFRIALNYGRTVAEVAQANGLSEPYLIHAGNQIIIPDPNAPASATLAESVQAPTTLTTYTVVPGDSLGIIAARYGMNLCGIGKHECDC